MPSVLLSTLAAAVLLAAPEPAVPDAALPVFALDQAIGMAKERNLDLKAAQARLTQARQVSRKAWSGYLPHLTTSASYTRNSVEAQISVPSEYYIRSRTAGGGADPQPDPAFDGSSPASTTNPPGVQTPYFLYPKAYLDMVLQRRDQVGAQVELSQALIAPALWPAIRSAKVAEEQAELDLETARREILFAVAQLYYGAAGLKQAVQAQQRLLELNRQHEQDAQLRFGKGTVSEAALLRAQIERTRAELDLDNARNAYQAARISLSTLLDRDDRFEVEPPPEPALPDDLDALADASRDRPDVAAARLGVALAEGQRTAALYRYLPNLGLTAAYRVANVTGFTGEYDAWAVTLGLTWVIYDGGLREAELSEGEARVAEREAQRRQAERSARDQVARDRLALDRSRSNRTKALEQLRLAKRSSEILNQSYRAGVATYLEVEDANATLQSAELTVVGNSLSANLAALQLLKAAGRFSP